MLVNIPLTSSQIQQYPDCFEATCKVLPPFTAPKEELSQNSDCLLALMQPSGCQSLTLLSPSESIPYDVALFSSVLLFSTDTPLLAIAF